MYDLTEEVYEVLLDDLTLGHLSIMRCTVKREYQVKTYHTNLSEALFLPFCYDGQYEGLNLPSIQLFSQPWQPQNNLSLSLFVR